MLALESSMPTLSSPLADGHEVERSPRVPATLSLLLADKYEEACSNFDLRGKFTAQVRAGVTGLLKLPLDRVAVLDCHEHVSGRVIVDLNILPDNADAAPRAAAALGGGGAAVAQIPPYALAERFVSQLRAVWQPGSELPIGLSKLLDKVTAATIQSRFGQLEAENAYLLEQSALMMARLDEVWLQSNTAQQRGEEDYWREEVRVPHLASLGVKPEKTECDFGNAVW
jgi:hypothetical protein